MLNNTIRRYGTEESDNAESSFCYLLVENKKKPKKDSGEAKKNTGNISNSLK